MAEHLAEEANQLLSSMAEYGLVAKEPDDQGDGDVKHDAGPAQDGQEDYEAAFAKLGIVRTSNLCYVSRDDPSDKVGKLQFIKLYLNAFARSIKNV